MFTPREPTSLVGDLLTCKQLDDGVGQLILDSQDLQALSDHLNLKDRRITGAIVYLDDGDYGSVWITESSRPFDHAATYEKVL